jgi:uncharacterized protein YraI
MTRLMTTLGAALLGLMLFPSLAQAATATTTVNVRNAPVNGAVVDVLRPGQQVDIDRCQSNGWCYVTKSGPDGWVSSTYLSNDDGGPAPARPSRPDVDVSVGFSVPGFSFQIGNGGFDIRPGRPGRPGRDEVCFYERANFRGDSFCAKPGDDIARLGRWDDNISSIRVRGDARALVCERTSFNGRCVVISRDSANLGPADDNISSIRVRGR